jgi:hypothetical protein
VRWQAVVEEMKHNIEGIEAFAWQPQTPARARASSLSGACALLSKLSSHSSGSLLREGSQVSTAPSRVCHMPARLVHYMGSHDPVYVGRHVLSLV